MSKILTELLQVDETKFRQFITRLEHASLRPGVDVRLGVDIITGVRSKTKALGLDVSDTTAKELYFGLRHKLIADDAKLAQKLALTDSSVEANTYIIAKTCNRINGRDLSLSMTAAGIKRILKAVPPKRTLKALKYRSLDSVLKRQDSRAFYALACLIENDSWHAQVYAKIRRLNAKDVQWQPVSCVGIPLQWYERLRDVLAHNGALVVNEEAGVVCILPVIDKRKAGSTVLLLGLACQAISHIATQSLPYRRHALAQGYANILPRIAVDDHPTLVSIHGLSPTWRAVHELAGKGIIPISSQDQEFELFDLFWETTEAKLASIVSDMDFWVGSHYFGARSKLKPVSLHVLDVAIAAVSNAEFGAQPFTHMRSSLWNELQIRYLSEEILSRSLLQQLSQVEQQYGRIG